MQPKHVNRNFVPEIDSQASDREESWLAPGQGYHPAPANIQTPSDAELIGILQRALAGDPHPVSGGSASGRQTLPAPTTALTDRIRDILGSSAPRPDRPAAIASMFEQVVEPEPALEPEPETSAFDEQVEQDGAITLVDLSAADEDLRAVISAVPLQEPSRQGWRLGWRSIAFVAVVAISGALLPAILAAPPQYRASARLQLDHTGLSHAGFLDVVAQRIGSPELLSQVVSKLKLDRDPAFSGAHSGALGVVIDLLSGSGVASDAPSRAQAALKTALTIDQNPASGLLALSVTSANAARSARIANMLADAAVYDAVLSQGAAMPGPSSLTEASRKAYDQAASALAVFTKTTGEDRIKAAIDLQQQKAALVQQADEAAKALATARVRLTATRGAKLADVVDGSLSPDLRSSPALEDLRNRYAAAQTTISALSAQLGPRHPRLLAQQATADDLRARIQTELQRLVSASDADVKAATAEQKAAGDRLAALEKQDAGIDMVRFTALQDAAEAARTRYENALQSGATEKPSAGVLPLSVAMPAVAPAAPLDDDRIATEIAGFLTGLGIALCLVFLRIWFEDMLADEDQPAEVAADEGADAYWPVHDELVHDEPMHGEPVLEASPDQPPRIFDIATEHGKAADWSVDQDIASLQDRMAFLRAKVERYERERRAAHG